jgi:hypothetical protein
MPPTFRTTITVWLEHEPHPGEADAIANAIRQLRGVSEVHMQPRAAEHPISSRRRQMRLPYDPSSARACIDEYGQTE